MLSASCHFRCLEALDNQTVTGFLFMKADDALLRTNDHYFSLTDQLNMGVRSVELDTHEVEVFPWILLPVIFLFLQVYGEESPAKDVKVCSDCAGKSKGDSMIFLSISSRLHCGICHLRQGDVSSTSTFSYFSPPSLMTAKGIESLWNTQNGVSKLSRGICREPFALLTVGATMGT